MFFQIVFVTCLLALASASPIDEGGRKNRVVGGRNAAQGQFPHQVSMQLSGQHFCGGSIISESWVVTAGHCIIGGGAGIVIKAGKHNVKAIEANEQTVPVQRVFVHEQYRGEVAPYDIALLKLSRPLKFNQYVKPISLPAKGSEPIGTATLSGWGSYSRTSQPLMPSILQTATLRLLDSNACKQAFRQFNPTSASIVHSTNVCTSAGSARQSACSGDSGGPLISGSEIVGIVSWGSIPCGGGSPSVYTKVSSFVDWINNKMRSN